MRVALFPLALLILIPPLTAQTKEEPLDTSILEEKNSLFDFLSTSQRLEYSRAEDHVDSGKSDLRRGEFMSTRETSRLNPDEDLTATRAEGKRLIQQGQLKIRQGQAAMVALLEEAKAKRIANAPPDEIQYDYVVDQVEDYKSALESAARSVLKHCWDESYNQVFFDRVFKSDAEGTGKANASLNNLTYDTLIEIDGTRFSLNLPTNFRLDLKASGTGPQFTFDDLESYSDKRIALLSIELIEFAAEPEPEPEADAEAEAEAEADAEADAEATTDADATGETKKISEGAEELASSIDGSAAEGAESTNGDGAAQEDDALVEPAPPVQLLVVQGLDMNTLQVLRQELRWIVPEDAAASSSPVEDKVTLVERKQTIQRVASLAEPYRFHIATDFEDPVRVAMLEAYVRAALMDHFSLDLIPVSLLQRTYPTAKSANYRKLVNARMLLQPSEEDETKFDLSAVTDKTKRLLPLGQVELSVD